MGLNTEFYGSFTLNHPLTEEHKVILEEFADTEHEDEAGHPGGEGKPPTLYCQWIPTEDGTGIEWDGVEKFYYASEWLTYLIANFLEPWGYVLNGSVPWVGTTLGTKGTLYVRNNVVDDVASQAM